MYTQAATSPPFCLGKANQRTHTNTQKPPPPPLSIEKKPLGHSMSTSHLPSSTAPLSYPAPFSLTHRHFQTQQPILMNQPPAGEDPAIPVLFFISPQISIHRSQPPPPASSTVARSH